jgi:YggT family protein
MAKDVFNFSELNWLIQPAPSLSGSRRRKGNVSHMFIVGYFFLAIATVINYVLLFFMLVVLARAVLSWVNPDPYNPIVRFITSVTEPVLYRIRRVLPVTYGGIDLSPVVVFLAIVFLKEFLVRSLITLSEMLM